MSLITRSSPATSGQGVIFDPSRNLVTVSVIPSAVHQNYTIVLNNSTTTRTYNVYGDVGSGLFKLILIWLDATDTAFINSIQSGIPEVTVTAGDGTTDVVNNVQSISSLYCYGTEITFQTVSISNYTQLQVSSNLGVGTPFTFGGNVVSMSGYLLDFEGTNHGSLISPQDVANQYVFNGAIPPFRGNLQLTGTLGDNSTLINVIPVDIPKYLEVVATANADNSVSVSWTWLDGQSGASASSFTVSDSVSGLAPQTLTSGSVYPHAFSSVNPVTFTVKAYDENNNEIGSNSATVTPINGTLTVSVSNSTPSADFEASLNVSIISDNSYNNYLTANFTAVYVFLDVATITIDWPAGSSVTSDLPAGNYTINDSLVNFSDGSSHAGPSGVVYISGINATSTGAIGSISVSWEYYDHAGIHAPFGNVLATATSSGGTYEVTSNEPSGSLTIPELPNGDYNVVVYARGTDNSVLSTGQSVFVPISDAPSITDVTSSALGQTVNVSWTNPNGSMYVPLYTGHITEIEVILTPASGGPAITSSLGNNSSSASFSGLPLDTYAVQVRSKLASNTAGLSDYTLASSGTDTVVVDTYDPPVLSVTSATSPSTGVARVEFSASNSLAHYYIITFTGSLGVTPSTQLYSTDPYESALAVDTHTVTVTAFNINNDPIATSQDSPPVTLTISENNALSVSANSGGVISWIFTGLGQVASYSIDITGPTATTYAATASPYTASGLSAGAYSVTVSALNDAGNVLCTGGSSFTVSDGNNGGSGHNPMSSALHFEKPDYAAGATQRVDITVIGQTQTALEAAQTIVVSVPLDALNNSLEITAVSGWNLAKLEGPDSHQKYPNVTFAPGTLVAAAMSDASAKTAEDRFLHSNDGSDADPAFADDAASANLKSLQGYMNEIVDENFAASDYQKIPLEAVKSVDRQALACTRLSVVLATPVDSLSTTQSGDNDYALRLFEQAAAAGKVVVDAQTDRSVVMPTFALGDSISVYVKYTLNKTRRYLLDEDAAPRAAFKVGNVIINPGDGDDEEISSDVFKTVEWKFRATEAAAAPAAPGGGMS